MNTATESASRRNLLLMAIGRAIHFSPLESPIPLQDSVIQDFIFLSEVLSADKTLTAIYEKLAPQFTLMRDVDVLSDDGLILKKMRRVDDNRMGTAVKLTPKGLDRLVEMEKPWWKKAYEKQPVTAIQVLATLVVSFVTFVGGYLIGSRSTLNQPSTSHSVTTQP